MSPSPADPVDALLTRAFDQVLSAEPQIDLVQRVMARIRRRQRVRLVVLTLVGAMAAGLAATGAGPLLEPLVEMFSDAGTTHWQHTLPALVLLLGGCLFGGWLLLDEPV